MPRTRTILLVVCLAGALVSCASATSNPGGGDGGGADAHAGGPDSKLAAPDANTCSHQPCSLAPQCGCAAGSACDLDPTMFAAGATTCRAAGPGGETTLCTADTDCAAGHSCIGGRCQTWCGSDGDCTTGAGAICVVQVTFGTPAMNIPGAIACSTDCDATSAAPAGCPATWGCHIYQEQGGAMRFLTDCDPGGAGGPGATCASSADCKPGSDCINVTRGTTTTSECHPSCICTGGNCATGTCPGGAGSCGAFAPKVMVGTREYGACL